MAIDRRRLLAGFAAGGAGAAGSRLLAFPGSGREATTEAAADWTDATFRASDGAVDWEAVRSEFDALDPAWTHLSGFLFVSHPRALRREIERFRARLDSDPYWVEAALYEGVEGRPYEAARAAVADYAGASPEEIAFTSNTTSAISLFYHGLPLRPGQEVLNSRWDHPVHHAAAGYAAARVGATTRVFDLWERPERVTKDDLLARVERAIGPKTRVLGLTWVHSSSGLRLPVADVAEIVARVNRDRADADRCLFFVDGVHGFGNQDVDAAKLGADFFAAGLHKWFLGPRGTGFLWGKKELWPLLRPTIPTFDPLAEDLFEAEMRRTAPPPTRAAHVSPGGFLAYEHFLALPKAAELHRRLGRSRIAARIAELNGRIREGVAAIPGVELRTPRDPRLTAGITCFEVNGRREGEVVAALAARRVRSTTSPYLVSYARFSAGIMTREAEVERGLAALREIAKG